MVLFSPLLVRMGEGVTLEFFMRLVLLPLHVNVQTLQIQKELSQLLHFQLECQQCGDLCITAVYPFLARLIKAASRIK